MKRRRRIKRGCSWVATKSKDTYPGKMGTPTAELLVPKILFNRVVLTKKARFMTADLANFYLNTPLLRPEYARHKLSNNPDNLSNNTTLGRASQGWVCVHWSQQGNLWSTAVRTTLKQAAWEATQQVRLLTKHIGPWFMETQDTTNTIHSCGQQLRC